jgi:hypothetical protein
MSGKKGPIPLALDRLNTLTDVVFAIVVWQLFSLLPTPTGADWHWSTVGSFLSDEAGTLVFIGIGLAITITYWGRHNEASTYLERSDTRHTLFTLLQLFCLFLYLRAMVIGVVLGGSLQSRLFESSTVLAIGVFSWLGFFYASGSHRLVKPDIEESTIRAQRRSLLAEPATALVTMTLAPIGPLYWELGWLSYPLVAKLLDRGPSQKL